VDPVCLNCNLEYNNYINRNVVGEKSGRIRYSASGRVENVSVCWHARDKPLLGWLRHTDAGIEGGWLTEAILLSLEEKSVYCIFLLFRRKKDVNGPHGAGDCPVTSRSCLL